MFRAALCVREWGEELGLLCIVGKGRDGPRLVSVRVGGPRPLQGKTL